MIYQAGDLVVHPSHGGCTVKEVSKREYGGKVSLFLVLIPQTEPNTTIMTPVENARKIGLRDLISEAEADEILEYFMDVPVSWVPDHKARRQAYEAALKSGDLRVMAKMIKELSLQATLNHCDKEILPKAQRLLCSELAMAKGLDYEHTMRLVNHAIAS